MLVKPLLARYQDIHPDPSARIDQLVELISDIREPLQVTKSVVSKEEQRKIDIKVSVFLHLIKYMMMYYCRYPRTFCPHHVSTAILYRALLTLFTPELFKAWSGVSLPGKSCWQLGHDLPGNEKPLTTDQGCCYLNERTYEEFEYGKLILS